MSANSLLEARRSPGSDLSSKEYRIAELGRCGKSDVTSLKGDVLPGKEKRGGHEPVRLELP